MSLTEYRITLYRSYLEWPTVRDFQTTIHGVHNCWNSEVHPGFSLQGV